MSYPATISTHNVHPLSASSKPAGMDPVTAKLRALTRQVFGRTLLFSFVAGVLRLAVPINMLAMYSIVIPSKDPLNAYVITGAALGALLAMGMLELIRSRLMIRYGVAVQRDLSDKVLSGMLRDSAEMHSQGFSEAMGNLQKVRNFVSSPAVFALFDCLLSPFLLLIVFLIHPIMGLTALIAIGCVALLAWRMEKGSKVPLKQASSLAGKNNSFLQDCLRGRHAIQAMGMTRSVSGLWRRDQDKILALQSEASDKAGRLSAMSKLVTMGNTVVLFGIGAHLVISSPLGAGNVLMAVIIAGQAIMPLHQAISNWTNLQEARQAYGNLKELLALSAEQAERMELPPPKGALDLEQLVFALPGQSILRGVSLSLEPGEFLGVIGPMAAGKTTLARLLTGVIRPTSGTIRLDGADMYNWDQTRLGKFLGYLPQEVELFPGTISENISRMAEPDPEFLDRAAAMSGLDSALLGQPDGLDTVIAEGGANLPGGLRQRIGLARALYGNPRLIILDEPDANLDQAGRDALLAALAELKRRQVTVVMVTHRVSLIVRSDKLLVLQQGAPVQYGPTQDVLAKLQNK
ncbi:type I secretion system permease/ATPase [Desulfonatronum thioautotrophicum]|uniref:type I secretion system permease/ATPase n=1 Tax=Desulfonatronum thioautotrophicum TaxID=617001 RepID=UPI0009FD256A|nr:type I secretion system permease/ATPase [Desulfonatronum thioautotrophicum]